MLKILCIPLLLAVGAGVFFALQAMAYALAGNPFALVALIVAAALITLIMSRTAFRMTVRKSQIERIAREYGVTFEQAEAMLPALRSGR